MSDKTYEGPEGTAQKLRDNGDGTHSPMVAVGSPRAVFSQNVAAAGSLSAAFDLQAKIAARVDLPADIGGATQMTFQVSDDGVTYRNFYNALGAEVTVSSIVNSGSYLLDVNDFASVRYLKVRFGSAAAPHIYANVRAVKVTAI